MFGPLNIGFSYQEAKEKAIKALDNVEDVEVILGNKEAVVTGKPNDEIVKKTVEELGFEFKGRK